MILARNGKSEIIVRKEDIFAAYPSQSKTTTPVALAITRETGRTCYVNRMGFVCDMWMAFAVINPAVYRLMVDWEQGRSIKPFLFDIYFVKEFDAYPGGVVTGVKRLNKKLSIYRPSSKKPIMLPLANETADFKRGSVRGTACREYHLAKK